MRKWLLTTGAIYGLGAVDFLVRPRAAPASLSRTGGEPVPPEDPPGVYNALAVAYMATIAALSLAAAREPAGRDHLVPFLLVAKATSSLSLLHHYRATSRRGFAAASALDAALFAVTGALWLSDR